jgi:protocatechuate 3,4-dioxygenase beta subunit
LLNDDHPIGTILTRRQILASLSAAGMTLVLPRSIRRSPLVLADGSRIPACVVRPAQTEGPYFLDGQLARSDIRSDPTDGKVAAGEELDLLFRVSSLSGAACARLAGVVVDLWQCDAAGVYSGVKDINDRFDTTGKKFLRGHQVTDAKGEARFTTIYPGWYPGRTVHIHFKLRTRPGEARGEEFTSQLYFDDAFSDQLFTKAPYGPRSGRRSRNNDDRIYRNGGSSLTLAVTREAENLTATFEVALSKS